MTSHCGKKASQTQEDTWPEKHTEVRGEERRGEESQQFSPPVELGLNQLEYKGEPSHLTAPGQITVTISQYHIMLSHKHLDKVFKIKFLQSRELHFKSVCSW